MCSACGLAEQTLGMTTQVSALSLYRKPSRLRDLLSTYKPGRDIYDARAAEELVHIVVEALSVRGAAPRTRLGQWEVVQVVPSTRTPGGDDLARVFARAGMPSSELLRWTGRPLAHREFSHEVFDGARGSRRQAVLLLEDAYVSGSRSQSAAAALRRAGHEVAGVLAIGRRVNVEFDELSRRYWNESVAALRTALPSEGTAGRPAWSA
jgi:hypothetical protein